ncbi:MAG: dicarboxylate/amino acid:cation symporter [Myxococcales bacterium]|nr:dicarboxylate/amino acid:cation symporter [Myxococcales bacterium]
MTVDDAPRPAAAKPKPHHAILYGVLAGSALGLTASGLVSADVLGAADVQWIIRWITLPLGQVFLRLMFMLAVPLIFAALVTGVAELDPKALGRIGVRTLAYTAILSAIAVGLGLLLVNVIAPGTWNRAELMAQASHLKGPDIQVAERPGLGGVVQMIPTNPVAAAATGDMLGLIIFALVLGVGLAVAKGEAPRALRTTIAGLAEVSMWLIQQVMRLAPVGVAALLFGSFATLGLDLFTTIGGYVATVLAALLVHTFVVYPVFVRVLGGMGPRRFFSGSRLALTTAFATASSAATLPTTLRVAETELGLPRSVARFVLTAGASMNQNGSALFEGVTVLFLAQVYGVDLSLGQQLVIMLICVLGGIGTAGIPGATLPVIAMMLEMVDVPAQGLALILGVDRVLDMCRTTVNVAGDLAIAVAVAGRAPAGDAEAGDPAPA